MMNELIGGNAQEILPEQDEEEEAIIALEKDLGNILKKMRRKGSKKVAAKKQAKFCKKRKFVDGDGGRKLDLGDGGFGSEHLVPSVGCCGDPASSSGTHVPAVVPAVVLEDGHPLKVRYDRIALYEDGLLLGDLHFKAGHLNAHCAAKDHQANSLGEECKCKMDRALAGTRKAKKGRPIGLIVAWLRMAYAVDPPTKGEHDKLKSLLGGFESLEFRKSSRALLKTMPEFAFLFAKGVERDKESDEESEPDESK
jgi:hypothetical protein